MGARAAVSLPDTPLRGAVVTGNPVRPSMGEVQRAPVTPPLVTVFGGSLGAGRLNDAALELFSLWRERDDVRLRHISGRRDHDRCARALDGLREPADGLAYELVPYEEHMERVYRDSAIVACRAGAVTVAELAATGTPAVLVPLPGAPGDHQTRNAEALVHAGAAVLVTDSELDGKRLAAELDALLADPSRLGHMAEAAHGLARLDAASRVADLVEEAARAA